MANEKVEIRKSIDAVKAENKALLEALKKTVAAYRAAKVALDNADKKLNKNAKTQAKENLKAAYAEASEKFGEAKAAFVQSLADINANLEKLGTEYASLAAVTPKEKEIKKQNEELEKFKASVSSAIAKATNGVTLDSDNGETAAEEIEEEAVAEEEALVEEEDEAEEIAPTPAPVQTRVINSTASVASVNVAPVTIDVTPIVERAIAATIQKLSVGMERKIAEYISGLNIPKAPATAAVVNCGDVNDAVKNAGANVELGKQVLEEEKYIFDKLTAMCEQLKGLLVGIADMSAAYMEIAAKQKEISELQKQTNDMQRHTMREQQGVQVNQRLVNKDQVELVAEQTLLVENQKAAIEKQQVVTEAQNSLAETQKAVIETQGALETAMKTVMQSQKDIIVTQQTIIAGNAKNSEAQKALIARQEEITLAQKEAATAQKQALKEQKAILERQAELKEGIKTAGAQATRKPQTRTAKPAQKPAEVKTEENKEAVEAN
jgi:hypothetical protein